MTVRRVAACLVVAGLLLWASVTWGLHLVLAWLTTYVSPDQQITADGARQLVRGAYFLGACSCVAGFIGWQINATNGWPRLKEALRWSGNGAFGPVAVLASTTILGALLVVHINLYDRSSALFARLYLEDGVFETLTALAWMAAAACLVLTLASLRLKRSTRSIPTGAKIVLAAIAAGLGLGAAEELSWGQRLIGIATPAWLPAGNTQNELNVHNYFTQQLDPVYAAFALLPVPVVISMWLAYSGHPAPFARVVLPHPSLIGLSLVIGLVAAVRPTEQELLEELLALFALGYAVCMRRYVRSSDDGAGGTGA